MSDTKLIQQLCDTIISYWANVPDQYSLKPEDSEPGPDEEENDEENKDNDEPQDFKEFKSRIKQIVHKSDENEGEGSADENEAKENKDDAQIGILGDGIFCDFDDVLDIGEIFYYAFDDTQRAPSTKKADADSEDASTTDPPVVGEKRTLEDSKDEPPAKKPKTEDSFWEKYKYVDQRTLGVREDPTVGYSLLIFEERATNERFYEMVFWDYDAGSDNIVPFGAGEELFEAHKEGETTDFEKHCNPTKDKFTQWLSAYVKHISSGGISHTPAAELELESSPTDEIKFHFCPSTGQTTKRAQ
jgi:hypothetical protein